MKQLTTAELIAQLLTLDQDALVFVSTDHADMPVVNAYNSDELEVSITVGD